MTIGGIQDGIIYTLVGPDGSTAVFNNPASSDYCGFARFTGLDDSEVRETADDRTSADGGIHGAFWRGRRPVVANIEIVPTSTTDRNTKYDKIMRAIGNALREDAILTWTPDGSASQFLRVRKQGPVRRDDNPGWLTRLQIPMVSADPLKYSTTLRTSTTSPVTNAGNTNTFPIVSATWDGSSTEMSATKTSTGESVAVQGGLTYEYVDEFSTGALPSGVCVDGSGNYWVVRSQADQVQKYSSAGALLTTIGSSGTGATQFDTPVHCKLAADGNLLVVDQGNHRIAKWNVSTNAHISNFGAATLVQPWTLAVDSAGNVLVGDPGWSGIQVFDSAGTHATDFGDTLPSIQGMEIRTGDVLVVAGDGHNIYEYVDITTGGTYVGAVDSGFYNVSDVALDASGNLFVLDSGWELPGPSAGAANIIYVYQFNAPGASADYTQVGSFASTGGGDEEIDGALGMGFGNGYLNVADTLNDRIEQFSLGAIELDMYARTAYIGQNNVYSQIQGIPEWWSLAPGSNAFTTSGMSAVSIAWRDAWQ